MKPIDLVQGTLDLLILKSLVLEPLHGWAIARRIKQLSNDVLLVQQGSLYPALQRLEHQGWVKAKWGVSASTRSPGRAACSSKKKPRCGSGSPPR